MGLIKKIKNFKSRLVRLESEDFATKKSISDAKTKITLLDNEVQSIKDNVRHLSEAINSLTDRCNNLENVNLNDELDLIDKHVKKIDDEVANINSAIKSLQESRDKTDNFVDAFNEWIGDPYPIDDKDGN